MVMVVVVVQLAGPQPTAAAHERLLRADPAPGATVAGPVAAIRLTFSDAISPGFAAVTFAVDNEAARPINATVDGAVLTVVPPDPAPTARQRWTLAYRVVSSDGHPIVDELSFTVTPTRPGDVPASTADSANTDTASSSSASPARPIPGSGPAAGTAPRWLVAVGAALLVVVVAVTAHARRRAATGGRRGERR